MLFLLAQANIYEQFKLVVKNNLQKNCHSKVIKSFTSKYKRKPFNLRTTLI